MKKHKIVPSLEITYSLYNIDYRLEEHSYSSIYDGVFGDKNGTMNDILGYILVFVKRNIHDL